MYFHNSIWMCIMSWRGVHYFPLSRNYLIQLAEYYEEGRKEGRQVGRQEGWREELNKGISPIISRLQYSLLSLIRAELWLPTLHTFESSTLSQDCKSGQGTNNCSILISLFLAPNIYFILYSDSMNVGKSKGRPVWRFMF